MDKRISNVATSVINRRHGGLIWPLFLYGVRPVLHALHLLRPQPDDSPYREPDPIA